nr:MAG TPA: hypothetical protein [Caudoviricetes sp.]
MTIRRIRTVTGLTGYNRKTLRQPAKWSRR